MAGQVPTPDGGRGFWLRGWSLLWRAAVVYGCALILVVGWPFLDGGSSRDRQVAQVCWRGAQLREAKLLDEAAVLYTRIEREDRFCEVGRLAQINKEQKWRSDAIERARIHRLVAAHAPTPTAVWQRSLAYRDYLAAFALDGRSPGARSGLRTLLRARARHEGRHFMDLGCRRADRLLGLGLLFEARELSGVRPAFAPEGGCRPQRKRLVEARRATVVAAAQADGQMAAGHLSAAFASYVEAFRHDRSSGRALQGLRTLPAVPIPEPRSALEQGWDFADSAPDHVASTARTLGFSLAILLAALLVWQWCMDQRHRRRAGQDHDAGVAGAPATDRARGPARRERHTRVLAPWGAAAGWREPLEALVEVVDRPGLVGGLPDAVIIEASRHPLDQMPPAVAAQSPAKVVLQCLGVGFLSDGWSAIKALRHPLTRRVSVRVFSDDVFTMTATFSGGETVRASSDDLDLPRPATERAVREAVGQLLGERVREVIYE